MWSKKATETKKAVNKAPNSEPLAPNVVHTPVLLREAVDLLAPHQGGVYLDGTLGAGGHASEILRRSSPDGILIGLDQDAEAIERCRRSLAEFGNRVILQQRNFRDLSAVLAGLSRPTVDGVLLDLGISWFHIRAAERGFSFQLDGPLDMRMDTTRERTAADLVNGLSREKLAVIIREYGEERRAGVIAKAIEKARARRPITRTVQLAEIISSVVPPYPLQRIHPATLTFQALRIAVNDEINALREGLSQAIPLLNSGGRIAVITFHSLEDRIVKQTFASSAKGCVCPPKMPVCSCGRVPELKVLTSHPITASREEIARNPAARSGKLRAAEKLVRADLKKEQ